MTTSQRDRAKYKDINEKVAAGSNVAEDYKASKEWLEQNAQSHRETLDCAHAVWRHIKRIVDQKAKDQETAATATT